MLRNTAITLADFLRTIYVPSRLELCAESIRQIEMSIRVFERWAGRQLSLADLSEDLIRQFLATYRQTHSAATTNSKRCQLLAIWRCAWEEDYLPAPPKARKIRKAKAIPTIPEAWSASQVGAILEATASVKGSIAGITAAWWWRSLLHVAYDTGERRSAMLATKVSDVTLAGPWIVFRRTKTKVPRWCPLSAEAPASCSRIYDPTRPLMWPWPFSREWLDKSLRSILKAAGVPYGRSSGGLFHKFRRTSGTLVESNGGDGAKHIGDTRAVFERHYRDPRFFLHADLNRLPRPVSV
jgi:integrase